MENGSIRVVPKFKRELFVTQVTKDQSRVRFVDQTVPLDRAAMSVPLAKQEANTFENQETSSVSQAPTKMWGLNKLKNLLKEQKEKMMTLGEGGLPTEEDLRNKYFRISVQEESSQQVQANRTMKTEGTHSTLKKQSTIKAIFQRSITEKVSQTSSKPRTGRKLTKRRKCRITTQQEFQQQCSKYIIQRQRQQTEQLFRIVNRQMKLSLKKKEGNNYYQKIRKDAIKKIDYMSFNQKYYDDSEVHHLYNVVDNCNLLIHKRNVHKGQQLYRKIDTSKDKNQEKNKQNQVSRIQLVQREEKDRDLYNRTSISSREEIQGDNNQKIVNKTIKESKPKRMASGKKDLVKSEQRLKKYQRNKTQLHSQISSIVSKCQKQREMLKDVKNGMKIFQFYCNRVDAGFAYRGTKLDNYLKGDEN